MSHRYLDPEKAGEVVNRAERRARARQAVQGKGFKGTQKQQAVRQLSAWLLNPPEDAVVEPETPIEVTQDAKVSRRKSGLYAVRSRGWLK